MSESSILTVSEVSAGYGKRMVIRNASFSVQEHAVVGLLGANGCGKTTLLKAICGIIPYTGDIAICGQQVSKFSAKQLASLCSYIPQRSGISIDISALDVVLMGFNPELKLLESPNARMKKTAREMLTLVGLGDRAEENYLQFSEGQKQLCMLARSMVRECSLMLMDEPESALDFGGRYRMLEAVKHITQQRPCAALVTLHDPQLALNICTNILLVKDGGIHSEIAPAKNSLTELDEKLSDIYGSLSVRQCTSKSGNRQFVLIKE